jgi:serine/threonine protein phosphatase 1
MNRTCIIGDIHGCYKALTDLLADVEKLTDTFVFLGDYIDRGPDSKKVVDLILRLQRDRPRVITLLGNHEYMLLNYLAGQESSIFLQAGGMETLASYGITPDMQSSDIHSLIPGDHLSFFKNLPLLWEDQYAIYVHAGLQPGIHLSQQRSDWCLWIRDEFIRSSYNFGKPVIFGHTIFKKPLIQKNKIGIDTGAVYGRKLTALLLPEKTIISVSGEQNQPYPMHF